jgi:hypothetical protein
MPVRLCRREIFPGRPTMRSMTILLIVAVLGACSPTAKSPATARGRVLFQGQPLAGGMIVFTPHPERGPATPPTRATLDEWGQFRLAIDGQPYIPAGWYRVAIADSGSTATWAIFPTALRRPDRSGIEREIITGQDNVFEFHIEIHP